MRRVLVLLILLSAAALQAQTPVTCPASNEYCSALARLTADARVRAATQWIVQNDAASVRELIELTQIPAPPFKEQVRGRRYGQLLRQAGADSVWTDSIGNVIGLVRGTRRQRVIGIGGHLDTVFPEGTDVTVRTRGDTLYAPGIADDTRGLVAMLQVLRALRAGRLRTQSDLLFIGTVGEEGLGDLRGMKYLFRAGGPRIDAFIAVDGTEDDEVTHQALGSRRYRVTFKGPGGHSWGAFGRGNPLHALGRAIHMFDEAAAVFTARGPRTSYNFGRTGGGTSVNSIPFEAWVEVDMRSEAQARLVQIDSIFRATVTTALAQQNLLVREAPTLTVDVQLVGDRPSGETSINAPLVQRAGAVTRHFGLTPRFTRSSTDANVPIARGVPSITIGSGGLSGNAHAPDEWYLNLHGVRGIQRILLIVLGEAGL